MTYPPVPDEEGKEHHQEQGIIVGLSVRMVVKSFAG
jgi:hypothetical protein